MMDAESRLRVAIVAPSLRQVIGGQEVQADLLMRAWTGDSTISARFVPINEPLPISALNKIPYVRTVLRFPRYRFMLWRALNQADIAHIFSAASWSFFIATVPAYALARLLRKRIIIHYHSPWGDRHLSSSTCARAVLRRADLVVVPTSYYVELFNKFRIVAQCIPNLVDAKEFVYRRRTPLRPLLLCTRNLEPYCGVDIAIRAFAQAQQEIPEVRLTVVGTGSQDKAIRDLIAELKPHHLHLAGKASRNRMSKIYSEADILINASTADNMPVSIMEAFAAGLSVVTTNAGGIPYFVHPDKTGLLSYPGDWHALASNIVRLLRTPELANTLSENAYRQSFLYRWDVVGQQWLAAYRSVLESGDGSTS